MNKQILVTRSSMPDFEEYCNEIKELWETHWLTNMGVKHKELEKSLLEYLKTPNITLFTNGHLALECTIAAFNISKRKRNHNNTISFASTTHAISRNGLVPVFCDINPEDFTIDADKIESLITEKTCAIIPVHVYGNLCDVEKIEKIAKEYKLKVIYDAAHAFGVEKDGIGVANFGDASMLVSLLEKRCIFIEGGAVSYKNEKLNNFLDKKETKLKYFLKNKLYILTKRFPRLINLVIREKYDISIAFLEGESTKFLSYKKGDRKKIAWVHTNLDLHKTFSKELEEYYYSKYENYYLCI